LKPASVNTSPDPYAALHPRRVHTITDRFSMANTYLIQEERLIVVDPGSELNVHLLRRYIERFLHRATREIDLIVLTHLHPDHTAGVAALQRLCKAPVAASAIIRSLAQQEQQERKVLPRISYLAGQVLPGSLHRLDIFPPAYMRQMQFIDLWLEDVNGLPQHPEWRIIAIPSHTPESLCLYNPFSQELLCGDIIITMEGRTPRLSGGANRYQQEETLRILRSLPVRYLYPGHGRPLIGMCPLHNIALD
jgi:hydroxyacylglutathione hydrolase